MSRKRQSILKIACDREFLQLFTKNTAGRMHKSLINQQSRFDISLFLWKKKDIEFFILVTIFLESFMKNGCFASLFLNLFSVCYLCFNFLSSAAFSCHALPRDSFFHFFSFYLVNHIFLSRVGDFGHVIPVHAAALPSCKNDVILDSALVTEKTSRDVISFFSILSSCVSSLVLVLWPTRYIYKNREIFIIYEC